MYWIHIFILCGALYVTGEVLYDKTSHISMFFAGGIIGVLGFNYLALELPYVIYALMIGATITLIEYFFGKIFNKSYTIWDYRDKRFNFQGQICLRFCTIWTILIPPIIMYLKNEVSR